MICLPGDASQCIQAIRGLKVLSLGVLLKIVERLHSGGEEMRRKVEVRKKCGQQRRELFAGLAPFRVRVVSEES